MPVGFAGARMRAMAFFCLLVATLLSSRLACAQGMVFIGGQPPTSATVGEPYRFQPAAFSGGGLGAAFLEGFGGGIHQFTVTNLPSWASFSPATGELSGTPGASDAGTYSGITITAGDGISQASLPAFSITVSGSGTAAPPAAPPPVTPPPEFSQPGSITLSWTPPSRNSDGSQLADLAGYKIYSGTSASDLQPRVTLENAGLTRYVVEALQAGERYFAVTAINSSGIESDLSNVAHAGAQSLPAPPVPPFPSLPETLPGLAF
jgi:hypothetical protein